MIAILDQDQHGYAGRLGPKGMHLRGLAPHGHWRPALGSARGALRLRRPINGQCFRAYVEQQLVTVLKPDDIVIMDNVGKPQVGRHQADDPREPKAGSRRYLDSRDEWPVQER